jgi:hypothetical protein
MAWSRVADYKIDFSNDFWPPCCGGEGIREEKGERRE